MLSQLKLLPTVILCHCFNLPVKNIWLTCDADGINPDDIMTLHHKHQIRMIFLNPTFQSPTGTVLSDTTEINYWQFLHNLGFHIVEDDPVSLLSFDDNEHYPLKSL